MKKVTFTGKVSNAHKKPLRELKTTHGNVVEGPLEYEASFDAFENIDEVRAANAFPTDARLVKLINASGKQSARSAAVNAELDKAGIIRPTIDNDVYLQLMGIYRSLMASKKHTPEKARELASATLGEPWPDEDEDDE